MNLKTKSKGSKSHENYYRPPEQEKLHSDHSQYIGKSLKKKKQNKNKQTKKKEQKPVEGDRALFSKREK